MELEAVKFVKQLRAQQIKLFGKKADCDKIF